MTEPTEPKPLSLLPRLKLKLFLYIVVIIIFYHTSHFWANKMLQSFTISSLLYESNKNFFVGFQKIKLSNDIELH